MRSDRRKVLGAWMLAGAVVFGAAMGGAGTPGGGDESEQSTQPSRDEQIRRMREAVATFAEANKLREAGKYSAAVDKYREVIALAGRAPNSHFWMACCLTQMKREDEALAGLRLAVEQGFGDVDRLMSEKLLDPLRTRKELAAIIKLAQEAAEARRRGTYSRPIELEGVRTEEGDPKDGLRWRLRMSPEASAKQPQRLVVWLHPAGGSMNETVERMAPQLVRHGFALLVFTQKQWRGWTSEEIAKVLTTLRAVRGIDGINAERPILLGYSAGGQVALTLWEAHPEQFGGLVLDAAYPLDMDVYSEQGKAVMMKLPEKGAEVTPMFVLVGDRDGGSRLWRKAEEAWKEDGPPLTVQYVEGKGHTWLFGKKQTAAMLQWLDGRRAALDEQAARKREEKSEENAVKNTETP